MAENRGLLRFRVRNVLIDMDGTIVGAVRHSNGDLFTRTLENLAVQRLGKTIDQVRAIMSSAYDPSSDCITRTLPALGISEDEYLAELIPVMKQYIAVYPDAASALKLLHTMGFDLYTATTNSAFAVKVKLACTGDEELQLASCFSRVLGGSEVHPQGKTGPDFYRSLISLLGIAPELTVMIGDNPAADLVYAGQGGISKVIIVNRDQPEEWIAGADGAVFVKTLELVPEILQVPLQC